ncbi:hypothetical protein [Tessaracoccus flavescens]|uniref:Uncharacterized protein n=1 Tax=Tessaracoccus flavescens TaxID=399497 RepID=A0A1Q2D0Z7_9ACTN|nr:hypothetical protein [Tessaracoccus flavescens]AQP51998.1 hypothetical protein BW733_15390 [Tessaracoccus flavescens]
MGNRERRSDWEAMNAAEAVRAFRDQDQALAQAKWARVAAQMGEPAMLSSLFIPEPEQWGLRGDPHAWAALKEHLSTTAIPSDAAETNRLLRAAFKAVVGADLDDPETPETVFRDEFAHGGTTSGHVHLPTWRTRLIPLLLTRARDHARDQARTKMADLAALQNELGLTE